MAVPTITSVTPAEGPTGGRVLVGIEGTNFGLPPAPALTGITTPPGPSVRVEFGSTEADAVWVLSASELLVRTPITNPGAHTVTVTNLDEDGNDIVGETASLASAYTTKRPDLTATTPLDQVNRTLRREIARQVLENTVSITHTEYDSDTGDQLSIIDEASLPAIALLGPRLRENRFQADNERAQIDVGGGLVGEQRNKATYDLVYTVVAASDSTAELVSLIAHFTDFFARNIFLQVLRDFTDADSGFVEYELALESPPETASTPNMSNIRHFTAEAVVRGVDCEPGDMVTSRVAPMVDLVSPNPEDQPRAWVELVVEQFVSELES